MCLFIFNNFSSTVRAREYKGLTSGTVDVNIWSPTNNLKNKIEDTIAMNTKKDEDEKMLNGKYANLLDKTYFAFKQTVKVI